MAERTPGWKCDHCDQWNDDPADVCERCGELKGSISLAGQLETAKKRITELEAALRRHGDAWAVVHQRVLSAMGPSKTLSGEDVRRLDRTWQSNSKQAYDLVAG